MEEILRNIYKQHSIKKQRQMVQKSLQNQQYLLVNHRRKLSFRQENNICTPATSLTIDNQIQFQKDLNSYVKKKPQKNTTYDNLTLVQNVKLPKITINNRYGIYLKKFKAAVWAVIFTKRLKLKFEQNLIKLKKKAQKSSIGLLKNIDRLVKEYYHDLLRNQLQCYVQLIHKLIQDEQSVDEKEIIEIIYHISQKLSNSTITQNILDFFILIATNKGFPPSDYLSFLQVSRLQFSSKYGYLINVSTQQTRMLIALGLGIKIFCYYVLCQPFTFDQDPQQTVEITQQIQNVIQNVSSIFYYIIIDEFCLKIQQIKTKNLKILQKFKIGIIKPLNPLNIKQKTQKKQKNNLLLNVNRIFFDKMQCKYGEKMKKIKLNIEKWINRISYVCLKQTGNVKNINMTTVSKDTRSPFKNAYTSLEMKKKNPEKKLLKGNLKYDFY